MSDFDWVRNRATDSQLREYVADKANLHNKLSLRGVEIEELQSELAAARQELGELQAARIRPNEKVEPTLSKEFLAQKQIFHYENWLAFELAESRERERTLIEALSGVRERRVKCPHTQGEKETK